MPDFNFDFKKNINYKKKLINFLKSLSNIEIGGNRIYDGIGNHYIQNPYEIAELIFFLKNYEIVNNYKFSNFLEIGFSAGINNTIINKFFNFKKIVAIDIVQPTGISYNTFYSNLRFKNLTLLCGDSTKNEIINSVNLLGKYDLIFIDGGHDYETVKLDFENYSNSLSNKGIIVLHDIKSNIVKGVPKYWRELSIKKKKEFQFKEIFKKGSKMECGLGIVTKIKKND